jgi:hypothetical protein
MAPSMYHPSVTAGLVIKKRYPEDEVVVRKRFETCRPMEIGSVLHIHDHCLVAKKRVPLYVHNAKHVCQVLRYMRRQGIAPLDVDIVDSTKGFLNPEKAESQRVHAPLRRWTNFPKEIKKIRAEANSFKEFNPQFRYKNARPQPPLKPKTK